MGAYCVPRGFTNLQVALTNSVCWLCLLVICSRYYVADAVDCPQRCTCINTALVCPGWNNSNPPIVTEMDNYEDLDISYAFTGKQFCKFTKNKVLEWGNIDGLDGNSGPSRLGAALAGGRIPAEWLGSVFFVWLRTFQAREAGIRLIDKNAFRYQLNLQCVDLMGNELERLNVFTWQHHDTLHMLRLTDNQGLQIPEDAPFLYSSSLRELKLDSCSLKSVNERTFSAMPKIKIIDLSRNHLQTLNADFFSSVRGIDSLILVNNSWVCNCELKDTWYSLRNDILWKNRLKDLTCSRAENSTSARWNELTDEDCMEVTDSPLHTTDETLMTTTQNDELFISTSLAADLSGPLSNFIGELTDDCAKYQVSSIVIMVFTMLIIGIATIANRKLSHKYETITSTVQNENTIERDILMRLIQRTERNSAPTPPDLPLSANRSPDLDQRTAHSRPSNDPSSTERGSDRNTIERGSENMEETTERDFGYTASSHSRSRYRSPYLDQRIPRSRPSNDPSSIERGRDGNTIERGSENMEEGATKRDSGYTASSHSRSGYGSPYLDQRIPRSRPSNDPSYSKNMKGRITIGNISY